MQARVGSSREVGQLSVIHMPWVAISVVISVAPTFSTAQQQFMAQKNGQSKNAKTRRQLSQQIYTKRTFLVVR